MQLNGPIARGLARARAIRTIVDPLSGRRHDRGLDHCARHYSTRLRLERFNAPDPLLALQAVEEAAARQKPPAAYRVDRAACPRRQRSRF